MRELIEKLYAKYNIGRGASDEEVQTLKRILAEGLWVQTTDSIKQWIAEREIAVLPRLDHQTPYKSLLTDKQIEDVCRYMGCGIAPIRVRAIDHMPESRFGPLLLARRAWDGLLLINLREDNPHFQENVQTILQYCINITEKKPYPAIAPIWLYKNAGEQKYGYISSNNYCLSNFGGVIVNRENFFEDIILPHLAPSESLFSFADDVRQDYDLAQWSISRLRRKLETRLSPSRIEEQMIKDSMKHYFRLHGANGTHAFVVYIRKLLYDEHWELGWDLYIRKKHIEYRNESFRILRKMCEIASAESRSYKAQDRSALKSLSERSTSPKEK